MAASASDLLRKYIDIVSEQPVVANQEKTINEDVVEDLFKPTPDNLAAARQYRDGKTFADNMNPYYPDNRDPEWIHRKYAEVQKGLIDCWNQWKAQRLF